MDIVKKAIEIATEAHEDQVRKTDGTPYIDHPLAVSTLLKERGFSDEVVAAAIVHDVLEDTAMTQGELASELNEEIAEIVSAVSENKELEWEERKKRYVDTVSSASEGVKAVSVADKIHNLKSLIDGYEKQGPAIWAHFNRGKEKKMWFEHLLLDAIKEKWDHPLVAEYERLIGIVDEFES